VADEAVATAYATAWASRLPVLDGHLDDLQAEGTVDVRTPLWRRPDLDFVLLVGPDEACLEFHGKRVRIPVQAGSALRFITESDASFTAADLPGEIDANGKLVLVRHLLHEGFLTARPERTGPTDSRGPRWTRSSR
jgi:hypothetical protein